MSGRRFRVELSGGHMKITEVAGPARSALEGQAAVAVLVRHLTRVTVQHTAEIRRVDAADWWQVSAVLNPRDELVLEHGLTTPHEVFVQFMGANKFAVWRGPPAVAKRGITRPAVELVAGAIETQRGTEP